MSTRDLRNVVREGWDQIEQIEGLVDSTVLEPGMLVEETADGYQPHSTDGGAVQQVLVAKDMRGRGFEVDPGNQVYADNDWITFLICNAGAELTMILDTGEDLTAAYPGGETRLVSSSGGYLRQFSGDDPDDVVARAKEGVDATGVSAGVRIDVEVVR